MQRTNKQYILMAISFGSATAILPFAIYRLLLGEWLVAAIDIVMVMGMLVLGSYVYIKRETSRASIILATLALGGACAVIYLKGSALIYWAYPTMVGMYFVLGPRLAVLFCSLTAMIIFPIIVHDIEPITSLTIFVTLGINNLFAYIFATGMHRQGERLTLMIKQDSLTGSGNRRALTEKLEEVTQAVKRAPQKLAIIMLDVDHFKRINDNFGHGVGDRVLIKLVSTIDKHIRITDRLYRFGGEEFVVLAIGADTNAATMIAEKFRLIVAADELLAGYEITISQGVAEYAVGESIDAWLNRADKALYKAKDNGRNTVCSATTPIAATEVP